MRQSMSSSSLRICEECNREKAVARVHATSKDDGHACRPKLMCATCIEAQGERIDTSALDVVLAKKKKAKKKTPPAAAPVDDNVAASNALYRVTGVFFALLCVGLLFTTYSGRHLLARLERAEQRLQHFERLARQTSLSIAGAPAAASAATAATTAITTRYCNMTSLDYEYTEGAWRVEQPSASASSSCAATMQRLDASHRRWHCEAAALAQQRRQPPLPPLVWAPARCTLRPFDAAQLWRARVVAGHKVLFVGDSLHTQLYRAFECALERTSAHGSARFAAEQLAASGSSRVRNADGGAGYTELLRSPLLFDVNASTRAIAYDALPRWAALYAHLKKTTLVLNTGAHYSRASFAADGVADVDVERAFARTVATLFDRVLRDFVGTLVVLSISPGHPNCAKENNNLNNNNNNGSFAWQAFERRNARLRRATEDYARRTGRTAHFLDLFRLSAARADAHPGAALRGSTECFHWCNPSPYSVPTQWATLLFNLLLQL